MSDIQDLHGVFPTPLRWSAETGQLGYSTFDPATGERAVEVVELGSPQAKFVMDLATRERGYGLIRTGLYDMRLTAVNSPPPAWPGDEDFKPAVACWMWNPMLGELRLETNAAIFRTAISTVWDYCRTLAESSQGQQPVVHFVDRREHFVKAVGKTFWAPIIKVVGWVPRDKVPSFALREPSVKPPAVIDSQVRHALLEHLNQPPKRGRAKAKSSAPEQGASDFIDDSIPW
jgi:hypothetical protein